VVKTWFEFGQEMVKVLSSLERAKRQRARANTNFTRALQYRIDST
jgi:hypothetical protein